MPEVVEDPPGSGNFTLRGTTIAEQPAGTFRLSQTEITEEPTGTFTLAGRGNPPRPPAFVTSLRGIVRGENLLFEVRADRPDEGTYTRTEWEIRRTGVVYASGVFAEPEEKVFIAAGYPGAGTYTARIRNVGPGGVSDWVTSQPTRVAADLSALRVPPFFDLVPPAPAAARTVDSITETEYATKFRLRFENIPADASGINVRIVMTDNPAITRAAVTGSARDITRSLFRTGAGVAAGVATFGASAALLSGTTVTFFSGGAAALSTTLTIGTAAGAGAFALTPVAATVPLSAGASAVAIGTAALQALSGVGLIVAPLLLISFFGSPLGQGQWEYRSGRHYTGTNATVQPEHVAWVYRRLLGGTYQYWTAIIAANYFVGNVSSPVSYRLVTVRRWPNAPTPDPRATSWTLQPGDAAFPPDGTLTSKTDLFVPVFAETG